MGKLVILKEKTMINVPVGYTDAHGFVYTEAVVLINHCSYSNSQTLQSNLQIQEGVPAYQNLGLQSHTQIGFTAVIFASAQALSDGKPPISFRPANTTEYFNILLESPIDSNALVQTCEQWLLDHIFSLGTE